MNPDFTICIPIVAATLEEAIRDIEKARTYTDLVELRLDHFDNINPGKLQTLLAHCKRAIVTCRSPQQGGKIAISDEKQFQLLTAAIDLKAAYIDIEYNSKNLPALLPRCKKTRAIVSYHNFEQTPSLNELQTIYKTIDSQRPQLVKIVTRANSINDCFTIFELLRWKKNLVAFCMGLNGEISRILAPKYGSRLTFAGLTDDKTSAPGQIDIHQMQTVYRVPKINADTKCIGVIGEYAEHSRSKYLHNPLFELHKLNYVFLPFRVAASELAEFLQNFRKFDFWGAAVTIPHKIAIMPYLDDIDETAHSIGAVNTVLNFNGQLMGCNTDRTGAMHALKQHCNLDGTRILVLGAGGATRAILYGLKNEDVRVTVVNRTEAKARELAGEYAFDWGNSADLARLIREHDIIINTTSVGMHPFVDDSPIGASGLEPGKVVMDIVYNPMQTRLIRDAETAGCHTITGENMLIYQAIQQYILWTGREVDFHEMGDFFYAQAKYSP